MNSGQFKKILVIRGGALGDFILTLPVLAALRRHFPSHALEILGYERVASLAVAAGLADRVSALESPDLAGFFARDGVWPTRAAEYFAAFELIISYVFDPKRIFQSNILRCTTARFLAGPHRPDETSPCHATQTLLRPLEELGLSRNDTVGFGSATVPVALAGVSPASSAMISPTPKGEHPRPEMVFSGTLKTAVKTTALPKSIALFLLDVADHCPRLILSGQAEPCAEKQLAVHPGSGSARKNWPEAKWAELLQRLAAETDWHFLLIGGEAEGARCDRLAAVLPPHRARLAQNRPIVELAQTMHSCAAYIGHDSGITHLAAALGLPGVVLWGPSNQTVWRPMSDKMQLLRDDRGLEALPVETVFTEMQLIRITAR